MSNPIMNRYEFVLLYDVENGNPNGDPDAGNMPRIDPETGYGIVTDVCIKRKIRNYVEIMKQDEAGFKIYVKEGIPLNNQHALAYVANNIPVPSKENAKNVDAVTLLKLRKWMCDNFFDIRTFGAVMTTGVNCGQVRGPVQINFSRSVDPIVQQEVTITRVTVTRPEDIKTMGRKQIVPYGLYRVEGYISAKLANDLTKGTGFSEDDVELLWTALTNMFDCDHSASHGKMSAQKLFIFKHESELGNAPANQLFDVISISKKDEKVTPRNFSDYSIFVDKDKIPAGVSLIERL
ncbi:type I-C CRISPR-associated protein Cas7/Csd2 [Flexilinea flocculi]|uniref:CRISPR-associated protein, Csd2 family n=1 Tax=Flexilinea flocculi TaxID=1678840 RepID=A0A0K8P9T3_9CHLR|nr:type I-C CRISPR-associated protein Cas7/Csd2 [Flexilinea flocculi]GAP39423.1 CRISPR-associated protein, Csd2 family [Flexilinea flocculi]